MLSVAAAALKVPASAAVCKWRLPCRQGPAQGANKVLATPAGKLPASAAVCKLRLPRRQRQVQGANMVLKTPAGRHPHSGEQTNVLKSFLQVHESRRHPPCDCS